MTTCSLWWCVISLALAHAAMYSRGFRPGNILMPEEKLLPRGCVLSIGYGSCDGCWMAYLLAGLQCFTYYYYFRFPLIFAPLLSFFYVYFNFTRILFWTILFVSFMYFMFCVHFVSRARASAHTRLSYPCWLSLVPFVWLFLSVCMHLLCYQWRVLVSRVRAFFRFCSFEFFS